MSYDKMHQDMLDSQNGLKASIDRLIDIMTTQPGAAPAANSLSNFNGKPGTSAATAVADQKDVAGAQTADDVTNAALDKAAGKKRGPKAKDEKQPDATTAPAGGDITQTPLYKETAEIMLALLDSEHKQAVHDLLMSYMPAGYARPKPSLKLADQAKLQEIRDKLVAIRDGEAGEDDESYV